MHSVNVISQCQRVQISSFVAMNNVVSQSIPHLHMHVVPRTKGDGLRGFFWPRTRYAEGAAASLARELRSALA